MELRELAERILFGTTLDEKLTGARDVTDASPGAPMEAPPMPGRPRELIFKEGRGGASDGPPTRVVKGDRERGRLLHFFANHELLATELMALVLLRFPDAPAAFRKGVLQTLRDEQEHTRLYVRRMQECGVAFGEYPVSGYFWRAVSPMGSPMDYVAGLSLTFEQANLDFCRQFARGFSQVGDADTARLLEGIYRDEIAHVAYGLKWFRRWKDPGLGDWEAFCRHLRFPLTPQRAKGVAWNPEGRRAAGLDAQFIAELRVYAASRGRTPVLHWFNPLAEGYVSRGLGFCPVQSQARLVQDLSNLPQYLARRDDLVVVPRRPSVEFLAGIQDAGFALPEFVEVGDRPLTGLGRALADGLSGRKLGGLRPWAWGPDAVAVLEPVSAQVTGEERRWEERYSARSARLYSKGWSAALLGQVLRDGVGRESSGMPGGDDWLCLPEDVGIEVGSAREALDVVGAVRARGHHRVVVKESLGLAGGNALRLWEPEVTLAQLRWLERAVAGGRTVVVEPWLERILDVSVHYEMAGGRLRMIGYSGLMTDLRGGYRGNSFAPGWDRRLPLPPGGKGLEDAGWLAARVPRFYEALRPVLEAALGEYGYEGPVGIDAFAYRDAQGRCRWKPVVEINPRFTMGRLTLALAERGVPGRFGAFQLVRLAEARRAGFAGFREYVDAMRTRFPVRLEGDPVPRLSEGFVCLNDPGHAESALAVLLLTRQAMGAGSGPGMWGGVP